MINMENNKKRNTIMIDEEVTKLSRTGINSLDNDFLNGGISEGTTFVIAGRPNFGKNYMVEVISMTNASDSNKTLVISLNNVKYSDNENSNLHLINRDTLTLKELEDIIIYSKNTYGIDVVVLNSIQLIRLNDGNFPCIAEEFATIADSITSLVKDLKLKAYIFSEVNRICEDREDKQPTLFDIRGYRILKEISDYIVTTCSDKSFNDNPNFIDINFIKNRKGPTGQLRVGLK